MLDPLQDPEWPGITFQDSSEYLEYVFNNPSAALFIDESGDAIGKYGREMNMLATRSRHYGHNAHFITQRAVQLDKTVRDQCSNLYVFRVSLKDAEVLSDDFACEELKLSNQLEKGEFYKLSRFKHIEKLRINFHNFD